MKRVKLESTQHPEREQSQEALLLRGLGFAFRVHQVIKNRARERTLRAVLGPAPCFPFR